MIAGLNAGVVGATGAAAGLVGVVKNDRIVGAGARSSCGNRWGLIWWQAM